jgi:CHAT domain-containing protein
MYQRFLRWFVFVFASAFSANFCIAQDSTSLLQSASTLRQSGRVSHSIAQLQSALLLAKDDPERMRAAGELGAALTQARQFDRAQAVLKQALALAQGEQRAHYELGLGNLASLQRDFEAALGHYQRAEQFAASDGVLRASAQLNQARLLPVQARLARLQVLEAELDKLAPQASGGRAIDPSRQEAASRLHLNLGHQAQSLGGTLGGPLAERSLERARILAAQVPNDRLNLEVQDALAQQHENQARSAQAMALSQQALTWLRADTQNTSADLQIALEWRLARLHAASGDKARSLAAYQRAVNQIEHIRQDIPIDYDDGQSSFRATFEPIYLGLVDGLLKRTDSSPQSEHDALLRRARDALELIKQTELQDYLGDRCLVDAVKGGSATVILPRTAVLYPVIFADRIEMLVETDQGMSRFTTRVPGASVRQAATVLSNELRSPQGNYLPASRQLYDWLLRPLEVFLSAASIETLVVVPDSTTRTVPLGALHDSARFAVEKFAITTATGLSMTNTNAPPPRRLTALVAGASSFGSVVDKYSTTRLKSLLAGPVTAPVQSASLASNRLLRSMNVRNLQVEGVVAARSERADRVDSLRLALALPGVSREMQALQGILPGTQLLDSAFTIDAFKQAAQSDRYSVVHLASHGVFGGSAESSYILAFDDVLTLDGLQNILKGEQFQRAPIEVLSLSACETAAGNDRAPLGISGAAMKARAKSVLGTLWPVDDDAAVSVMTRFYTGIAQQGESKARALQQSQVQVLRNPQTAHPFFWAPFSLIGNWL